jgi:uncharacterized protein YceH (UPF0502 family)
MHHFENLEETENQVHALCESEPAFLVELPRQSGRKEHRYAHLLSGMPEIDADSAEHAPAEAATAAARDREARMAALEAEVCELRNGLEGLTAEFAAFREQFE